MKENEHDWGFDDGSPSDEELNLGAYTCQQNNVIVMKKMCSEIKNSAQRTFLLIFQVIYSILLARN